MNLLTYFTALLQVKKEINVQKKFNDRFLVPYIKSLEAKYNGTFAGPQLKKILQYYGLFIPSVLCASYYRLYNKKLSDNERERVSLFGILTPVGDDLFDIDKLDIESIRAITYAPHSYHATTFSASVAKQIQGLLINTVPEKELYLKASKNVFDIQIQTTRQTNAAITNTEIEAITWAKGGYSVIIYHQTLNEKASAAMQEALYEIGALMQFANDCFDIYKDIHDGIFTLASRCSDYRKLKQLYLDKVRVANQKVRLLPYSKKKKDEFLVVMHVIISQGLVAIDQMIVLQDKLGQPVDSLTQPRKALITDMQKLPNIIKWMKYAYRLPFM